MRKLVITAFFGMLFTACAVTLLPETQSAQERNQSETAPFNAEEAHKAIETLAKQLEENFIYPDIGKSYAGMLRAKLASGAYSKFDTAGEFAKVVTDDLQAVHPEGHLRLQPPGETVAGGQSTPGASDNINGVGKYGLLAPGVGYISIHGFSGNRAEFDKLLSRLRTALEELSAAKTLIIDARPHRGGALEEMDIMFSYFFAKPTTLVMMDTRLEVEKRGGSPLIEGATLKRVDAPEGIVRRAHLAVPSDKKNALAEAKIYILTSNRTASAGEHLLLAMKRTGRATLIGETSRGAGHFGRTTALGGGYRAFIPVGRTFDPDTDKGWEQTGVEPNIKVPADQALDKALEIAGVNRSTALKALESFKID
jgi:hypothetical protein